MWKGYVTCIPVHTHGNNHKLLHSSALSVFCCIWQTVDIITLKKKMFCLNAILVLNLHGKNTLSLLSSVFSNLCQKSVSSNNC